MELVNKNVIKKHVDFIFMFINHKNQQIKIQQYYLFLDFMVNRK